MSRSSELRAFLKGLEKVAKAAATHQETELSRRWANSSLREAAGKLGTRAEEAVSDAVVKQVCVLGGGGGEGSSAAQWVCSTERLQLLCEKKQNKKKRNDCSYFMKNACVS